MKIILPAFFIFCALLFCIDTDAQTTERKLPAGYSQEKTAEGQTRWMTRELKLDENLSKKVYEINLKYIKRIDSTRMANTSMIDQRTEYASLTQSKKAELQGILTIEQYGKYLSLMQKK